MTLKEDVLGIYKKELKVSETLIDLTHENEWDDIDQAFVDTAAKLISKANDPQRKKSILIITFRMGESMESEPIVNFAKDHLEEWMEKYD